MPTKLAQLCAVALAAFVLVTAALSSAQTADSTIPRQPQTIWRSGTCSASVLCECATGRGEDRQQRTHSLLCAKRHNDPGSPQTRSCRDLQPARDPLPLEFVKERRADL